MVVGRTKEKTILENLLTSKQSELLAIYGRRRIGKTFLIRETYKKSMVFELTGLFEGNMRDQLRNFHEQLKTYTVSPKETKPPKNWFEAFELLRNYLNTLKGKKKKVIFIDEFPWVASSRSKFLMLFEHFWNTYCSKRNDMIVVVCGSAASFMVQKIIKNKGGLHGRISTTIQLAPFNLHDTKKYLVSRNIHFENYDILQLYMAIGGIPYYLSKIEKGLSVVQNIDKLCFEKGGALVNEFDEVLLSLFNNSDRHKMIIQTLSKNKKGMSRAQLISKGKLNDNGHFSKSLTELNESGFIEKYNAFEKRKQKALYRLSDEFCMFYLKFIKTNKGQGAGTWQQLFTKQTYKSWSGLTFESVCLKHIIQIKKALGVDKIYSINSSWFNNEAQIDLIIDRDDNRINICEMKFYSSPFTIDKKYAEILRNKIAAFKSESKTKKHIVITMITTYGIVQNSHSLSIVENTYKMNVLFEQA